MGLRDWVSEKGRGLIKKHQGGRRFNGAPRLGLGEGYGSDGGIAVVITLQWGSETGSRRRPQRGDRERRHARASMGLRDWVSEKVQPPKTPAMEAYLLQWGSETGSRRRPCTLRGRALSATLQWGSETGSRRRVAIEVKEGSDAHLLQWGSETGSRRRPGNISNSVSLGKLQWGSETGSRRRRSSNSTGRATDSSFNGAPRLGLGEGICSKVVLPAIFWLSFNGAPRLGLGEGDQRRRHAVGSQAASMGLRDRVSEKDTRGPVVAVDDAQLQWGSETGSRRRAVGRGGCTLEHRASMGLRDWVSEKVTALSWRSGATLRFNGAPRLGLGEGRRGQLGAPVLKELQWGSETGSRRRTNVARGDPPVGRALQWGSETGSRRRNINPAQEALIYAVLQWGSETGSRRRDHRRRHPCQPLHASMGLRDWVSEKEQWRRPVAPSPLGFNGAPRLGLGEGPDGGPRRRKPGRASMGLRDWVSEKESTKR